MTVSKDVECVEAVVLPTGLPAFIYRPSILSFPGPHTLNLPKNGTVGSVGREMPGVGTLLMWNEYAAGYEVGRTYADTTSMRIIISQLLRARLCYTTCRIRLTPMQLLSLTLLLSLLLCLHDGVTYFAGSHV